MFQTQVDCAAVVHTHMDALVIGLCGKESRQRGTIVDSFVVVRDSENRREEAGKAEIVAATHMSVSLFSAISLTLLGIMPVQFRRRLEHSLFFTSAPISWQTKMD